MDLLRLAVVDTTDYVSFILSFPNMPPQTILTLFFLTMMRLAPIVAFVPFFGSKLPSGVKMGLLFALVAILLPKVILTTQLPAPAFNFNFSIYALKELLIGMVLAILASMPFYIAQSSGVLIDFLRGSSALMVTDPIMQSQTSPIGQLYNYVFIVLFYQIDGPFLFLDGVMNSYALIPANALIPASFFNFDLPFWVTLTGLLTKFTALSIQLAAPSLVAILMAEMFLGIANRLAPQVQIAFLGMSIKSLLGLALLWAGWFFILQQLAKQSLLWLQSIDQFFLSIPRA